MIRAFFFDIDGTLADCSHRLHHIDKTPKDWRSFFAACADDAPIAHMIELAHCCAERYPIVCVSARSDEVREETRLWLHQHGVSPSGLFMRRAGDHRDDPVIKIELLAEARAAGFEPLMVFDDRDRVVKAFRAAGIPVAQVAEGNF